MTKDIVIFITAPGEEEAANIAKALVSERLAACVNIIGGMRSIYRWKGKLEDEREALMIVKTREELFDAVNKSVKRHHSYSVPEVIAVPIVKGSEDYLKWLHEVTGLASPSEG